MSKEIVLKVEKRLVGKGNARRVRKTNYVPAIVYGSDTKNVAVSLDVRLLDKYSTSEFENSIFVLDSGVSDLNKKNVLIKRVDRDPVSRKPIHVDFYAPNMKNKVKVSVEIKFEGKSKGEASGGQLEIQIRNIEVECLPADIPKYLAVDTSPLDIGDTIHISDIKVPEGVKFTSTEDIAVCSVKQIKEEEIAKPEAKEEDTKSAETEEPKAEKTDKADKTDKTDKADKK